MFHKQQKQDMLKKDNMVIKYSPDFTGEYYLDILPGKCLMEQMIVDDTGLLEAFELRLGLPSRGESRQIRVIEYRRALNEHKVGSFYEKSFAVDSFGVAESLLSWRDALLMQGWQPSNLTGQERLDTLSVVEKSFRNQSDCPGAPDRWIAVLDEMDKGQKPFSGEITLELWYPHDMVPTLVRDAIDKSGIKVDSKRELTPKEVDFSDKKVELRRYTELTDAFEAFALEKQSEGTVLINRDNYRFNAILRRYALALEQASTEKGNPSIPQIFKLGLSLLVHPVNPHTLLSFLQLPKSPLPHKLASELASALLDDNGIGKGWQAALAAHPAEQDKAKKYLLDLIADRPGSAVPRAVGKEWCDAVVAWAEGCLHDEENPVPPMEEPQYAALASSCRGMSRLLGYEQNDMDPTDFSNLIKSLYISVPIRTDEGEVHSFDTVASPAAILSTPSRLVWLDCNGVLDASWPFAFLMTQEVDALQKMGVKIPAKDLYFKYGFSLVTDLLSRVDDIVLVRAEYDCGEPLREHPAVTLARQAGLKEKACPSPEWTGTIQSLATTEPINFGGDLLGTFTRKESASSIEKLMEHPLDYYLEYVLRLKDIKDMALKSAVPARGLVAHLTFENLMANGNKKVKEMLDLVNGPGFRERVRAAAVCKGADLLLGEKEVDFEGFVVTLKDSFNTLLNILAYNHLEPYATEFSLVDASGNGVNLGGQIGEVVGFLDLVVKTTGGDYVVIDLKYPQSSGNYYTTLLQKDNSVQLEIYAEALAKRMNRPVIATAYYLIPLMKLCTCAPKSVFDGNDIYRETKKPVTPPLLTRINDGMKDSRAALRAGMVPLGEKDKFAFGRQADTYEILKGRIK